MASTAASDRAHERLARLVATPLGALLLLVASQLPLTRHGIGSGIGSLDAVALLRHSADDRLRWGGRLLVVILASGLVLGPLVVIPRRWASVTWWIAAALVAVAGTVMLVLLGGDAGGGAIAVLCGGSAIVLGGVIDGLRTGRPSRDVSATGAVSDPNGRSVDSP